MLRDDKALILGLIVDTFGTGAFAASSLIFFVAVRGVDVSEVGLAVTVGTILSFSTLPLAERVVLAIGARNAVAVASAVSTAGLILCGLTVGFWSILAASFVLTVGDRVHSAAWPILASQRFPDSDIAVVFGKFTAIKSATMGTGAALAAVAAYQLGVGAYTLLFVVNMVTTAASILLTLAVPSGRDGGERPSRRLQVWRTLADTRFMTLLISQACLSFVWLAPTTLLPLLIVEHLGLPAGVAALVVAVRYAMIFLLQVPIVNAVHGRSRWWQTAVSSGASLLALVAYLLTLVLAHDSWVMLLILGGCLVSLGEMVARPTGTAWALRIAPSGEASSYMSTFQLASFTPYALAPTLAALAVAHPAVVISILGALVAVGAVASSPLIRQAPLEVSAG